MTTFHSGVLILTAVLTLGQTTDPATLDESVPPAIRAAISSGPLGKTHEISFHINPFYLRADFNGDGLVDHAVLVKHRASGKMGIAMVHGGSTRVVLLGAGTQFDGGDDFDWLDWWYVHPKGLVERGVGERRALRLRSEALHVGASESASGLIYWNGTSYRWYQQGD